MERRVTYGGTFTSLHSWNELVLTSSFASPGWAQVEPTGIRSWARIHGPGSVSPRASSLSYTDHFLPVPIGDMSGVGVDYPRNPRFDEQGRWLKRDRWPQELR